MAVLVSVLGKSAPDQHATYMSRAGTSSNITAPLRPFSSREANHRIPLSCWPLFPKHRQDDPSESSRQKPFHPTKHHDVNLAPNILSKISPYRPGTTELIK